MPQPRTAHPKILYRNTDISNNITDFIYTDTYDQTDDIRITLSDKNLDWLQHLHPTIGEQLQVSIILTNWNRTGDNRTISLGAYEIDEIAFSGAVTISAVAVPITTSCRSERKNVARKNINLSTIAADIASPARLALFYDTDIDPFYEIADQTDKTDLEFLEELCKADGLCMKITNRRLIVYEESKYNTIHH